MNHFENLRLAGAEKIVDKLARPGPNGPIWERQAIVAAMNAAYQKGLNDAVAATKALGLVGKQEVNHG